MEQLTNELAYISQRRKVLRRRICKFIRHNIENIPSQSCRQEVKRRSTLSRLGDYVDSKLVQITRDIVNKEGI